MLNAVAMETVLASSHTHDLSLRCWRLFFVIPGGWHGIPHETRADDLTVEREGR